MSNYSNIEYLPDPNLPWHELLLLVDEKSRVLDVGCSSGTLGSVLMKEKKCEVVGIDLDRDDIKLAKKKLTDAYVLNIEKDDVEFLGTFDYIIFADVIEHLVDPSQALIKTQRLLNKRGSVLFSIPNMAHMGVRLMLLDGQFNYAETGLLDKTHLHFYDRQEIERVFMNGGYKIKKFTWGERYIPEKIISERLERIGLKPSKLFFDKNKEIDAIAYQYFGQAVVSKGSHGHEKLAFVSPYVSLVEDQIAGMDKKYFDELERVANAHEREKNAILSSTSWRVTKPIRLAGSFVRKVNQKKDQGRITLSRNSTLQPWNYPSIKEDTLQYAKVTAELVNAKRSNKTRLAVVLHLYYTDSWRTIQEKLQELQREMPFDLYVTMPLNNQHFVKDIIKDYPNTRVFTVPNRGRDVLPFIGVAQHLKGLGYEYVLKMHSKKSPHREDGRRWFLEILDNLIPSKHSSLQILERTLSDEKTGIIGPAGQYVTLAVNYDANSLHFSQILSRVYRNKKLGRDIEKNRYDYGFFAGTMFWSRLDALQPIFELGLGPKDFEKEKGSTDATLAHAIERVFCVVPELNGRTLLSVDATGTKIIAYNSGVIPEWSNANKQNRWLVS